MGTTAFTPELFQPETMTLPEDFILKLKGRIEAKKALLSDLPRQIAEDEAKYKAALMFAPPGFDPDAPADEESAEDANSGRATWTGTIKKLLDELEGGMTHPETLKACLEAAPQLSRSSGDKGFYNAVKRLADRGDIVKHSGRMYSPKYVKKVVARGDKLPDEPHVGVTREGQGGALVLNILKAHPNGITGPELKAALAAIPDAPRSFHAHGQYVYSVLHRLIGNKLAVKDGQLYKAVM